MRLLFVAGIFDSQTARWISQLEDQNWDIHVFDRHNLIHEELKRVTVHTGWKKKRVPEGTLVRYRWPFRRGRHFVERHLPYVWRRIVPPAAEMLANCIETEKPDCIHVLGSNPYGYTFIEARRFLGGQVRAPWIYSCKGNDIYDWGRTPGHAQRLRELLSCCQYYIANCQRDVELARQLGFRGRVLGLFQGGGGYPITRMQALRAAGLVSRRRVIALKGLQGRWGKALTALEGLKECATSLRGYELHVYQAHSETRSALTEAADVLSIPIEIVPRVHYRQIWELFGRARLAIGVNEVDGIPNAMIEAMIMGAYPVQTNPGGATAEWIDDGVNGSLVPHNNSHEIAEAIRMALENDELVDSAAERNLELCRERIDGATIRREVVRLYECVTKGAMRAN